MIKISHLMDKSMKMNISFNPSMSFDMKCNAELQVAWLRAFIPRHEEIR